MLMVIFPNEELAGGVLAIPSAGPGGLLGNCVFLFTWLLLNALELPLPLGSQVPSGFLEAGQPQITPQPPQHCIALPCVAFSIAFSICFSIAFNSVP